MSDRDAHDALPMPLTVAKALEIASSITSPAAG
jgi:hypothetical protein